MMDHNLLVILGHTAGGKTGLAAAVAAIIDGEIISADSRQVYRGMDIGTGKDYQDYIIHGRQVPFHLVDIVDAGYEYNVFEFRRDFWSAFDQINANGRFPVLCGGTGLYIESILRDYNMADVPLNQALREKLGQMSMEEMAKMLSELVPLHNRTDLEHRKRLTRAIEIAIYQRDSIQASPSRATLSPLVVGLRFERQLRRKRITERLQSRLASGMLDEAQRLMGQGLSLEKMEYYGLEYKFLGRYLAGMIDYDSMVQGLNTAIHQFAKRQMTYFRGMERRGVEIRWLEGEDGLEANTEKITGWLHQAI